MSATPPPMPARRMPGPRVLLRQFRRQPRGWLVLLVWPLLVLALVLVRHLLLAGTGAPLTTLEAVLLASGIAALAWGIVLARGFYLGLRAVRKMLFDGSYEKALELVRHHPALAEGMGLESVLELCRNKPDGVELILTGRNATPEVLEAADLVTEMKSVKHYYENGVAAREGIEH